MDDDVIALVFLSASSYLLCRSQAEIDAYVGNIRANFGTPVVFWREGYTYPGTATNTINDNVGTLMPTGTVGEVRSE